MRAAAGCACWALAVASAIAAAPLPACGLDERARPPALPPLTTAEASAVAAAGAVRNVGNSRVESGDPARIADAAADPAQGEVASGGSDSGGLRRVLPEPTFGSDSPSPGDAHPFRLAAALRAMRASRSGKSALRMLSLVPAAMEVKEQTGVDPFTDGEWLLVYGARPGVPGSNACVLKHGPPEAAPAAARDAGTDAGGLGRAFAWPPAAGDGARRNDGGAATAAGEGEASELLGVKAVLLRPQPGMLALVPSDRARDLAAALSKPIDLGVKPGELVRAYLAGPVVLRSLVSRELSHVTVVVKAASDGGLDVSGESDCPDAASCTATASDLADAVRSKNGVMARLVVGDMLGTFAAKADGTKLRASLHAEPHAVDALLNLARAELGVP